ncbi:MAG: polysaccharide deacetylase family protein [Streptosporangiaceae bacterium]
MTRIPVLLYHSVSADPSSWIAHYTVTPETFARQMDAVIESDRTPLTVSGLRDALRDARKLPPRPVVITFDDGFADTLTAATPALARRDLPATTYITTGAMGRPSPGGDAMLQWSQLDELRATGHELGGHTRTHPELDTVSPGAAGEEIKACKDDLEQRLGFVIRSFAYPYGYSNSRVREIVRAAGYESACSVKNAFSVPDDPEYSIARLAVTAYTSLDRFRGWLDGAGTHVAHPKDTAFAIGWRTARRLRSRVRETAAWPGAAEPRQEIRQS